MCVKMVDSPDLVIFNFITIFQMVFAISYKISARTYMPAWYM